MKNQDASSLLDYLSKAPTPYHSVEWFRQALKNAGGIELKETEKWELSPGSLYYFTKDKTALCAFRLGTAPLAETGFRISGAHHDAPGFHIKAHPSAVEGGYERILTAPYGGLIVRGWFDRPLGIAGLVCIKTETGIEDRLLFIDKPLLVIPSPAIHIMRDINEGNHVNLQTEALPVFSLTDQKEGTFLSFLADTLSVQKEDILSYELSLVDVTPPCFIGAKEEMICAGHLDDASMVYASFRALIEAKETPYTAVAFAFDHEEIGSLSTRGARGALLSETISRICEKCSLSVEDRCRAIAHSIAFSADMAHATHPAYPQKADPYHKIQLNKGPVLKESYYQSYASSPKGSAVFRYLCEKNGIPYQVFVNHSDQRGGGTIGPVIAASEGILTVDIGNPMLSMHAVRELGGSEDVFWMRSLFLALFTEDLTNIL